MEGLIKIMKKMIFGVLLTVIGLSVSITIFASFYAVHHSCIWGDNLIITELDEIFWLSVFIMLAGIAICAVEAFKKPKNNCKSE